MADWLGRFLPALFLGAAVFGVLCLLAAGFLPEGRRLPRTLYLMLAAVAAVAAFMVARAEAADAELQVRRHCMMRYAGPYYWKI